MLGGLMSESDEKALEKAQDELKQLEVNQLDLDNKIKELKEEIKELDPLLAAPPKEEERDRLQAQFDELEQERQNLLSLIAELMAALEAERQAALAADMTDESPNPEMIKKPEEDDEKKKKKDPDTKIDSPEASSQELMNALSQQQQ